MKGSGQGVRDFGPGSGSKIEGDHHWERGGKASGKDKIVKKVAEARLRAEERLAAELKKTKKEILEKPFDVIDYALNVGTRFVRGVWAVAAKVGFYFSDALTERTQEVGHIVEKGNAEKGAADDTAVADICDWDEERSR